MTSAVPKARYRFFEASVEKEESEWPEKHKRARKWMKYAEAKEVLKKRSELAEALEKSGITR